MTPRARALIIRDFLYSTPPFFLNKCFSNIMKWGTREADQFLVKVLTPIWISKWKNMRHFDRSIRGLWYSGDGRGQLICLLLKWTHWLSIVFSFFIIDLQKWLNNGSVLLLTVMEQIFSKISENIQMLYIKNVHEI